MRKKFRVEYVFYLILLLALADALWLVGRRVWREQRNKNVEIVIGYDDVTSLAKIDGLAPAEILAKFKQAGCVSAALAEETLSTLAEDGRVVLAESAPAAGAGTLLIKAEGPNLAEKIFNNLVEQVGTSRVRRISPVGLAVLGGQSPFAINTRQDDKSAKPPAYPEGLENLGVGFSRAKAGLIKKTGLGLVLRLANSRWLSDRAINEKISGLRKDFPEARNIIFSSEEVLGYPANLIAAARALRSNGFNFGLIEFSSQLGAYQLASALAKAASGNDAGVVNVHSITPEEMPEMTLSRAVARWSRAAQERGLRLFYVHPFPRLDQIKQEYGQNLTEENIAYIENIVSDLKANGFTAGPVKVNETVGRPLRIGPASILLLTLGIGVGGLFLLKDLSRNVQADLTRIALVVLVGLAILALVFYFSGLAVRWEKLLAWLAAVIFPSWAVVSCFARPVRLWTGQPIAWAAASLTRAVLIGLLGAIMISAILGQSMFFLRIDQFSGVKAALILPFLLVTYFFWKDTDWGVYARRLLARPISLGLAIFILAGLAAGALFLIRSGNYLSGAVSPIEIFFRRTLEVILGVRPRTKEFLIGYPALFLSINLAARGFRRLLVWFWALVGTLGPVSLINTYCHLHTPLLVSLRRSFNGYILGVVFGIILIYLSNLALLYLREQKLRLMNERTAPLPFSS